MTDYNAIKETGKEPDTLDKIIEDVIGALVPMMRSMLPVPTRPQLLLLGREYGKLAGRIMRLGLEANNGNT